MTVELEHVSQPLGLISGQREIAVLAHMRKVEGQVRPHQQRKGLPASGRPIVVDRPERNELNLVTESRARGCGSSWQAR